MNMNMNVIPLKKGIQYTITSFKNNKGIFSLDSRLRGNDNLNNTIVDSCYTYKVSNYIFLCNF